MITKTIELGVRSTGFYYADFIVWHDGNKKVIDTFVVNPYSADTIVLWLKPWIIDGRLPDGRVGYRQVKP